MAEAEGTGPLSSLSDVFGGGSDPAEKSASDSGSGEHEEGKDEGDQKFPVGESSPEKSDAKADDEKDDKKEEKSEKPSPDAKKESKEAPDAKSDSEKKEDQPSKDEKAKEKWESEDNPYFKRFRDTSANWNKEHQEKLALQSQMSQMQQDMVRLQKIADGTYDPEKDDPAKQYTPEIVASKALEVGKALASRTAAVQQYGEQKVDADLAEFHQTFGNNSLIQHLVLNAEAPVYEAFRILDRFKFETKYGSTPADIHKNIKAEVEKELRESLRKEITAEVMGRVDKSKSTPRGLSSSRGSNGVDSSQNSKGKGPTSLGEIFSR